MFLLLKPLTPFLLFLVNPLPHKPFLPSWAYELGLLVALLFQESLHHSLAWIKNRNISKTLCPKSLLSLSITNCDSSTGMPILDLPELAIECILEKLSPADLCRMANVCRSFRARCSSDHLWKRHMIEKWSRILGLAACGKRELQISLKRNSDAAGGVMPNVLMRYGCSLWPLSWLMGKMEEGRKPRSALPADSLISFYLALESGRYSFPAQVYNRENGNAGFLMSCYDAEISYNNRTDKFYARYPPHGKRVPPIEEVPWGRIRAPKGTSAHDLHISDCLSDLNPGDHIEIQWRRNKDFPYGWWYGVVGHLEVCERVKHHCCCHASESIVLEFNHFERGSRWWRKTISRRNHREDGNEVDGFYGGIRKIQEEEISVWMHFWPADASSVILED